jgi:putative glutamine amidotransferase
LFTRLAIRLAGGKAERFVPSEPDKPYQHIDGLILGGGADIDPGLYGESLLDAMDKKLIKHERSYTEQLIGLLLYPFLFFFRKLLSVKDGSRIDRARDALEWKLIRHAVDNHVPVLGICRGAQLINIYFKGTLYRDITPFYGETPQVHSILPKKQIHITPGTLLESILQTTRCKVNALHYQAIRDSGENLSICARETNQVVQAVEHIHFPFVLGVQWHPEYLPQQPRQRLLFQAFVKACAKG